MFTKTFALMHRGLRLDARLLKVHLLRLVMIVMVVGMLFITHIESMAMSSPGLSFFREITWITFVFATLSATTFFATTITEEKEERTLGLLALANIGPLALILGKFLPRLVGDAKARELLFTADRVDAQTCLALGLVNRVVLDDQLMDETLALARRLASGPSLAYRLMKKNVDRAHTVDLGTQLAFEAEATYDSGRTEDHREAVRAFVEKRKPDFRGR